MNKIEELEKRMFFKKGSNSIFIKEFNNKNTILLLHIEHKNFGKLFYGLKNEMIFLINYSKETKFYSIITITEKNKDFLRSVRLNNIYKLKLLNYLNWGCL